MEVGSAAHLGFNASRVSLGVAAPSYGLTWGWLGQVGGFTAVI